MSTAIWPSTAAICATCPKGRVLGPATGADCADETYQNGGFWTVPVGWTAQTLALVDAEAAEALVAEGAGRCGREGRRLRVPQSPTPTPAAPAT